VRVPRRRESEIRPRRGDRLRDFRIRVTEVRDAVSADAVDVFFARGVDNRRAGTADDRERVIGIKTGGKIGFDHLKLVIWVKIF